MGLLFYAAIVIGLVVCFIVFNLEKLQAQIGESLLPAMRRLAEAMNDVHAAFLKAKERLDR
jgi:hypothetical protein